MSKKTIFTYICLIALFIQSAIREPNDFQVTRYQVANEQLKGICVVFLSDFHFKKKDYKKLKKIADLTIKEKPDIILLGGDYTNSKNPKNLMSPFVFSSRFKKTKAPMFAVLGEADWKNSAAVIKKGFKSNGIKVLENSSARVEINQKSIYIVGIGDKKSQKSDITKAFKRTKMPRIVITHNPDIYFDIMEETSIIFAGHTHGGQFLFPFTPPLIVDSKFGVEFASGTISKTSNQMIISKGLGTRGIPLRLNCKPEIVVVNFI